jgi:hypothetical protein
VDIRINRGEDALNATRSIVGGMTDACWRPDGEVVVVVNPPAGVSPRGSVVVEVVDWAAAATWPSLLPAAGPPDAPGARVGLVVDVVCATGAGTKFDVWGAAAAEPSVVVVAGTVLATTVVVAAMVVVVGGGSVYATTTIPEPPLPPFVNRVTPLFEGLNVSLAPLHDAPPPPPPPVFTCPGEPAVSPTF